MASLEPSGHATSDKDTSPTRKVSELSLYDKKQRFISLLKKKYKEQYDAVQPIPYIKERMYCVEKIFVESGVLALVNSDASDRANAWERLGSYKDIFSDSRFKSNRRIIEGEPGYGKSTLTLQLAYDWCNDVTDSPLAGVEILILLRLRQLRNVTSIYRAIRLYLVPELKTKNVREIIESTSSVVFQLDGYDEYAQRDKKGDDIQRIITSQMFPKFDVSLTTRYLPQEYEKSSTKRVKLTGFDDIARDHYIRKAVCGDDEKAIAEVKKSIEENVIIDDLCQVPLFFSMLSHMTHEREEFKQFTSVTDLFKYVMKCLVYHTRNKSEEPNVERYETHLEVDHDELNKIAFEGLSKENQQIVWRKEYLVKRLGQESYNHHIRIGILVEEYAFDVQGEENFDENILTRIEVSFYHKIFCEWYASFYVAGIAAKVEDLAELEETLGKMSPFDLQYVYRFACGLNSKAGSKIIEYLSNKRGCSKYAILCIMERNGKFEEIVETVRKICSDWLSLSDEGSKVLQRSTVHCLQRASKHNIPISNLYLRKSFRKVDGGDIVLQSGLRLPSLSSLEKLSIDAGSAKLSAEDVIGLLNYGSRSTKFNNLWLYHCELPDKFNCGDIPESAKTENVKVLRPSHVSKLDLRKTGKWEKITDIEDIREICSDDVVIDKDTDEAVQSSVIDLLKRASSNDISIFCVKLFQSLHSAVGSNIILSSGLSVPVFSSLERMEIDTEEGREINDNDTSRIFRYLVKSNALFHIGFRNCLLPSRLDGSYLEELRQKKVSVFWRPYGSGKRGYRLDFHSGRWTAHMEFASLFPTKKLHEKLTDEEYDDEVRAFRRHCRNTAWQRQKLDPQQ